MLQHRRKCSNRLRAIPPKSIRTRPDARCVLPCAPEMRGSVLLVVLVVVALLSLGAYTFAEFMRVEAEATMMFGRGVETRAFADSGVELVATLLTDRSTTNPQSYCHNPEWFRGIQLRDGTGARGRGRFSIVAPLEADLNGQSVRFGLVDESTKLNLNALQLMDLNDVEARELLLGLPEMTPEIADAILDWLDPDDDLRQFGAESEYY